MKNIVTAAAILLGATLSSTAFAQEVYGNESGPPKGIYIGAGFGYTSSDVVNEVDYGISLAKQDSSTSYKVYGGVDFGVGFGMEFGYYNLGQYSLTATSGSMTNTSNYDASSFAISGTFVAPISDSAFFWGTKLGLAWSSGAYNCQSGCSNGFGSTSTDAIGVIFGLGVGYNINKNFSIRADWEAISGINYVVNSIEYSTDVNLFSLSAQFRF